LGRSLSRVRLGIGHPGDKRLVSGYVLHDFSKADQAWLDPLLTGFADGFAKMVKGDDGCFQNAVALQVQPPRKQPAKAPGKATPYAARAAAKKPQEASKRVEKVLENAKPDNPLARLLAKFSR
ncbi:MAG: aminoacyl-tRNA hydrolase, partial [Pseudomonadota bacterium]